MVHLCKMGKGLQKINFTIGEQGLTHYAGMVLIHSFCKSLDLKRFFQIYIPLSHRNTYYHSSELLLAHFYFTMAGLARLTNAQLLKHNGLIPAMVGLKHFPSDQALRRFIKGMTPQDLQLIRKAHQIIRDYLFLHPQTLTTAIADMDSTVLTVYGHHEKAEVGYNTYKRGRRSYHPLLAFESHLQMSLSGELRPGNLSDRSKGVIPFVGSFLDKIPGTIAASRTRVRADSGFCSWPMIEFLEGKRVGYVIVARVTKPMRAMLPGLRYRVFNHEEQFAVATFIYHPQGWKIPHQFISIRHQLPPEGQDPDRHLLEVDRFDYHVLVSNLDLHPEFAWHFYSDRANLENRIKELKYDFSLNQIPTRSFLANEVQMELLLMEYDLFRCFQILCLPPEYQNKTLDTIRDKILMLPAKLVSSGHSHTLKLPAGTADIKLFNLISENIKKVKALI